MSFKVLLGFNSAILYNSSNLAFSLSLTCKLNCLIASLIVSIEPSIRIFSSRDSFNFISSNFNLLFISLANCSVSLSKFSRGVY